MSNSSKDTLDLSDLNSSLPAAAAALSEEDRAGLVNSLKNKLQDLAEKHVDVLELLTPTVRKRVEVLRELQLVQNNCRLNMMTWRLSSMRKEQHLKQNTRNFMNLCTLRDLKLLMVSLKLKELMRYLRNMRSLGKRGVPSFWLTAMNAHEVLAEEITERDEEALKYLKDIKWCRVDDPKGFKLEFFFSPNPFFKSSILTKTYHMIDEDDPILEKAIGTDIEWYPGKCLTQKILKKKPKKGSKNTKQIVKTETCESFFNFFNPPEVPDDEDIDEEIAEDLQNQMEQDFDIGSTIRDKIIPHAVSWFTGEAAQMEDFEDDEDEDEDEEEDDDDEEEDKKVGRIKKPSGSKTSARAPTG